MPSRAISFHGELKIVRSPGSDGCSSVLVSRYEAAQDHYLAELLTIPGYKKGE